ncbi:MAG: hypothetical protein OES57_14805 [Acidimicrobiia bacterium]|nr:hypothetical protein [Acidimicrobiia bacterium]
MTDSGTNTAISRDDLEHKLREVQTGIEKRADDAKSTLIPAGIAAGIIVLLLAYFIGKRVGTKKSAIVEIRRI